MPREIAPYGSWRSPITSDLIVSEVIGLGQPMLDGGDVYWVESRPAEAGRSVLVRRTPEGTIADLTPPAFSARTRVHEYGGGAYTVAAGTVYFSNDADQRIYRQPAGGAPQPLTAAGAVRFADAIVDPARGRLLCVCEDHGAGREPLNTLVAVDLARGDVRTLIAGEDFYSNPRLSPGGRKLAWLSWNHPNMPWDGTVLWVAALDARGLPVEPQRIAGGANESIFQPEWSPDGTLYFASDRSGWWNLYRWHEQRIEPLVAMDAEFGSPQWGFNMSTYAVAQAGRIICTYCQQGRWQLGMIDTETNQLRSIDTPYTHISGLRANPRCCVFVAASPVELPQIVRLNWEHSAHEVLRRSSAHVIDPGYLSTGEAIRFASDNGQGAHAFFYRPRNRDFEAPAGTRPPLVLTCHGGPTGASADVLSLKAQFFTSRGFAFLAVNYRGSSNYGRAYRRALDGQWGIADVADCVHGARHLIDRHEVDGEHVAISGGSAGGYTVLCALTFYDLFRAGASHYGISDLEALARDTHKFESHYLDRLVGPYPERQDLYRARSPIHFIERLSCPVIFFQGLEDRVVPPSQTERMVAALRAKMLPVAYLAFAGEQHGFRQARHIKAALDAELYFYLRVFGLLPANAAEVVRIENL